jgi:hypothetical protein
MELEKVIKLKELWRNVDPSQAQVKLRELQKYMNKGGATNDGWINEYLKWEGK